MPRLDPLTPDRLDDAQRAVYDAIVEGPRAGSGLLDERGALRGPFDALLRSPRIGDAVQRLGAVIRYEGDLPDHLRELAILCAASEWRCGFELAVHGRIAESVGVDPPAVDALRAGEPAAFAEGSTERAVHDAARELFATKRLSDATHAALVAALGEAQTVEVLVVFGYYSLLAMLLEGFEVS